MLGGLLCGSPFNNTPSVGAITWEKPTIIYVDLSILQKITTSQLSTLLSFATGGLDVGGVGSPRNNSTAEGWDHY